jgi:hypothetical protein
MVAVLAMGGLGKAQLSLTFTRHNQAAYSSLFGFNAKDEATLRLDCVTLATSESHIHGPGQCLSLVATIRGRNVSGSPVRSP